MLGPVPTCAVLEVPPGGRPAQGNLGVTIQHTEDTKDVPSGKRGWHRPVALEYARHWNMQQPGSGTSLCHFMQCRSLDTTVGKSQSKERHCIKWGHRPLPLPAAA